MDDFEKALAEAEALSEARPGPHQNPWPQSKTTAKELVKSLEDLAKFNLKYPENATMSKKSADLLANIAWAMKKNDKTKTKRLLDMLVRQGDVSGGLINEVGQWLEGWIESEEPEGEPVEEAKRTWRANGYIEFKPAGRLSSKHISALKRYILRWANGAENAGPSMLPRGKRWKATDVLLTGGKIMVAFETDAEANSNTVQAIENEVIGKDGVGGMLWQFAVQDSASPDDLQMVLYGGFYQADDPMNPIRSVASDIQPNVGFDEERRRPMARNPFGHAINEDAEVQLASVLGEDGARRVFEDLDARLPIEEVANPKNASAVMSKWEEDEPTGPVIDENQMEQGVRYEIVNVQPGDFGGMAKHQGERSVKVMGNTFAIKDELKRLGFRFNPNDKTWELKHEYTSFGKARGAKRDVVEKAVKKIDAIVKDANAAIQKRNQAALAGAGVTDDTKPSPADLKGQIKYVMSAQRLTARLKKNGIGIYFDWPHSIGGFAKGGAFDAWVIGNTFGVKDQLKRFGFSFSRSVPSDVVSKAKKDGIKRVDAGWVMDGATYDRIHKQVDQTLLRAAEGTL